MDIALVPILIAFLVLLFSLSVHEAAHAWTADRLGDPTARRMGRVSLNPLVHLDPVGTVLFPLIAIATHLPVIGWARPVPVNVLGLLRYRRDFLLIAAAGPASNLMLAMAAAAALSFLPGTALLGEAAAAPLFLFLRRAVEINVLLSVFNMLPIPPLDGGTVLSGLLPDEFADRFDDLRPYGFLVLYALMLTGVLSSLIAPPYYLLLSWLL
jgi:Zn-dependent protease